VTVCFHVGCEFLMADFHCMTIVWGTTTTVHPRRPSSISLHTSDSATNVLLLPRQRGFGVFRAYRRILYRTLPYGLSLIFALPVHHGVMCDIFLGSWPDAIGPDDDQLRRCSWAVMPAGSTISTWSPFLALISCLIRIAYFGHPGHRRLIICRYG
jgi:hypothetical protein